MTEEVYFGAWARHHHIEIIGDSIYTNFISIQHEKWKPEHESAFRKNNTM